MADSSTAPTVGDLVAGKYRIVRAVARGGMGAIYEALQEPLGRPVALKLLHPGVSSSEQRERRERRFFREAALTANLAHPNTVVVHDFGTVGESGEFYLAMEFLEGVSLREELDAGIPFSVEKTVHIASQVADSLADAHEAGLVHRDLKPSNIMLVRRGDDDHFVKVVDFGLAKPAVVNEDEKLTGERMLVGTPTYIAPERYEFRGDSAAADIYALGVIIYEMLAGRPPFVKPPDAPLTYIMLQHLQAAPSSLTTMRPTLELPQMLEATVMECLQKEPADRPTSMGEVAGRLRASLTTGPVSRDRQAGPAERAERATRKVTPIDPTDITRVDGPIDGLPSRASESLIWSAVDAGAKSLQIEPSSDGHEVRYRTGDGEPRTIPLDEQRFAALEREWREQNSTSRNQAVRYLRFERGDERVHVRVQRLELVGGDRITLRFLPDEVTRLGLEDIALAEHARTLRAWCEQPRGLVLISGRPGSGKTTTAYACLWEIARRGDRTVFTLEEKIGFPVDGIYQVEVSLDDRDAYRQAFAGTLEQQAEVLFIGSSYGRRNRDLVWSTAALAAESGLLVFLQMEADSADDAIERLAGELGDDLERVLVGAIWQELRTEEDGVRPRYDVVNR